MIATSKEPQISSLVREENGLRIVRIKARQKDKTQTNTIMTKRNKEKLIIPSWLTNIIICGEDRDQTIIPWDDHANIKMPVGGLDSEAAVKGKPMDTFHTYTLKEHSSYITN